jgi:hypothetical protein
MRQTSAPDQLKKGAAMKFLSAVRKVFINKISLIVRVSATLACSFAFSLPALAQTVNVSVLEQFRTPHQHFSCTVDYALTKCVHDLQRLHRLLEQYNADGLGDWQWVVVSRAEWKPLCVKLGVDFRSPAMTSFLDHQAFFDEALFDEDPIRARELVRKFGAPWKELLALAVTHELGHAVCRDVAETRAEFFAEELRQHRSGRCDSTAAVSVWSSHGASPGP